MLRFIMRRNLPAGLFVVFERPDDALYVVFVDFFRGFRVSLYKQLMQRMCAVCSGIFFSRFRSDVSSACSVKSISYKTDWM